MKDFGYLWYFLDIEVAYSPRGYLLSQLKYIADILEWARLTNNKIVDTLIEVNTRYSSSDGLPLLNPTLYRTVVGNLAYLTITHPDIEYVVHIISEFVASPTTVHWALVLHILQYLRGYSLSESFTSIHLFLGTACILWCWSWQWSYRSQVYYWFLSLFRWFSYFL